MSVHVGIGERLVKISACTGFIFFFHFGVEINRLRKKKSMVELKLTLQANHKLRFFKREENKKQKIRISGR